MRQLIREWWLLRLKRRRNESKLDHEIDERVRRFMHEDPDTQIHRIGRQMD